MLKRSSTLNILTMTLQLYVIKLSFPLCWSLSKLCRNTDTRGRPWEPQTPLTYWEKANGVGMCNLRAKPRPWTYGYTRRAGYTTHISYVLWSLSQHLLLLREAIFHSPLRVVLAAGSSAQTSSLSPACADKCRESGCISVILKEAISLLKRANSSKRAARRIVSF